MTQTSAWKSLRAHGPILLVLVGVIFLAFRPILLTPLWHVEDFQILQDAYQLSANPGPMFHHLGFYVSQPLLQVIFLTEYRMFGIDPAGYLVVNLILHSLSSFIIYMLVNMLFPSKRLAFLAALMFAVGVGSYGKVFMTIHQLESLLLATLHFLILYLFIRNDFRRGGALRSPLFLLGLGLFLLTGLTKSSFFSLVACLLAYKLFFNLGRGWRVILAADIQVIVVSGILYYTAQHQWGYQYHTAFSNEHPFHLFTWISAKNIFRYLTLMFFPVQKSGLIDTVPGWVQWLLQGRFYIRIAIALSIMSYSFFGLVFGSRAVRFFIAWTYLTVLPFTGQVSGGSWLNLTHLYVTSLGFCVVLAAGTIGTSNLLIKAGRRRFVPYLVPALFIVLAQGLTTRLVAQNKRAAQAPIIVERRIALEKANRQ